MIQNYDLFHWEFNQISAVDFFPLLLPFYSKQLKHKRKWTIECKNEQPDFLDSSIDFVHHGAEPKMEWETALHLVEEVLPGFSAVGNFLMKVFGFIGAMLVVQQRNQTEIDAVICAKKLKGQCNSIELEDRTKMPYTEAVIMESLRLIASPIIPHAANRTSSIGGYLIEKDSVIFLNNYNLNMSPDLWDAPAAFKPERFIQNGHIVKPDHFLPFGTGKRSCVGYEMVQAISFSVLASCMQHFSIRPPPNVTHKIVIGSLAVPEKSFEMILTERIT